MTAYYNEFDKNAAAWLRELCGMKLIENGKVDERSIVDVSPDDVRGRERVHWFAGIGGWDLALQFAGWQGPVWTASLPCQPFSCAGKQLGKSDERHLLPHFLELVNACRPPIIFGEQVPGAIRHGWLDDLCDSMEREGYTVRAAVLTAAGIGAPHIRQRLYWVANANDQHRRSESFRSGDIGARSWAESGRSSETDERVADSSSERSKEQLCHRGILSETPSNDARESVERSGGLCRMGNAEHQQHERCISRYREESSQNGERSAGELTGSVQITEWSNPEWLYCRDNKYRPIKPGIKPLVDGVPRGMVYGSDSGVSPNETGEARAMRLKGYGNAIVPQVAAEFIKSVMGTL